jgi:hypothetical protein
LLSQLQLKALQTCKSLFQKQDPSEVNIHFIHALGPEIVRLVESSGTSRGNGRRAPAEPPVVIEASQVLETLLSLTAEANSESVICSAVIVLCVVDQWAPCVQAVMRLSVAIVLKFLTHSLAYLK